MSIIFIFFLIFSSSISFVQGMDFNWMVTAAQTRHQGQEQERLEREREQNADIKGYEKTSLALLGFRLREKDAQDPLILDYYNRIEVYQKEGEFSYIDLHARRIELVQDFVTQQMKRSENLAEVMQQCGFFDKFEGKGLGILSKIFNNCRINHENKFNTDGLLKGVSISFFEKISYAGLGFSLALPICYLYYLKFCK